MQRLTFIRLCAALVCVAPALAEQPVAKGRFEKEIAAFEAAELAKPSPPGGIVFTGASGIRMWRTLAEDFAGLPVINRAFGGSYTSELTEYADRILIPLKPRVIALQPGSNDLTTGKTPEQVLADFQAFVTKTRGALPDVRIVYLGINPSPKRWPIRDAMQRTNALIRDYTQTEKNLAFVDLWPTSIGPDGQPVPDHFIADELHPSRKAYQLRAPIIRPYLEQTATAGKAPAAASSNYDESKIVPYALPDLFTLADGGKVTTSEMWESRRRAELLEIFRREVYGFAPPKPETLAFRLEASDPVAMEGKATRKQVAISFQLGGETFAFHVILFVPNQRTAPAPVFLLLNHRPITNTDPTRQTRSDFWPAEEVIARGYAIAAINVSAEVEPDKRDATAGVRTFYRQHFAKPDELTWGALAAWAWAGSRALDYFETNADVNAAQVSIIGHSRTGKTALWAAAEDTRFALACANGAGEGGPALARRNFGETLSQITTSFPYWFAAKYATYADKVETLPIDQHELVALVAPRGYHGGDGTRDSWADPRGLWLSLVEASKVWAIFGKTAAWQGEMPPVNELRMDGSLAYHIHEGGHDLTALDWKLYLDHADQLFRRKN